MMLQRIAVLLAVCCVVVMLAGRAPAARSAGQHAAPDVVVSVSPARVPSGTTFTAAGRGFAPSETVDVFYIGQLPDGSGSLVDVKIDADSGGAFVDSLIPVPAAVIAGHYRLTATGQSSRRSAYTILNVVAETETGTASPTATPIFTATATATPTARPLASSSPTLTPRPAVTPTGTPPPTATATLTAIQNPSQTATTYPTATATPTRTTVQKPYILRIKYAYLWYAAVRMGTSNHIVVQANHKARLAVTLFVIFPNGTMDRYSARTDPTGRWERSFPVPAGVATRESTQALALLRLKHNLTTQRADLKFQLLPPSHRHH